MKRLVLCCDGTWNTADQEKEDVPTPTNVIRVAYRVAKRDAAGNAQVTYYHQGVGTGNSVDKITGGAFGDGLEDNVHEAYRFLVANYERGDEIFLFGFSRGAFTARSIAGMIRKSGILSCEHIEHYEEATKLYHDHAQHPDNDAAVNFRRSYGVGGSEPIPIKCVAVWDTVGALGVPSGIFRSMNKKKYELFDTELSGTVQFAFHALAIDEHRKSFAPTLWLNKPKPNQTVEQVWFAGAHSDVGGGYAEDGLSNIALRWMLARTAAAGLFFNDAVSALHPITANPSGELHNSRKGFFLLQGSLHRAMDATDSTQSLHESVLQRWDAVPDYRPQNLRDWFKARGDARATA